MSTFANGSAPSAPLALARGPSPAALAPAAAPPGATWNTPSTSRGRVLVVDDEPAVLRSIRRTLSAIGYEVETCADGEDASKKVCDAEFDVVVSDIAMPGVDGIQLLQAVRRHSVDLPVVLITGEPAVSTAVKALEYGAFHYLTKPVNAPDLEEVIDKAVCLRRMAAMQRQAAQLIGEGSAPFDMRRLEASFSRALESLWIAYQPIVSAQAPAVYGYEALLRSSEPSLPHPGAVIDAAERLGQLDMLGRTIRDRASEPFAQNQSVGALFVNLHADDLLDSSLLMPESPLSQIANRVVLEITERASLDRVKDLRSRVASLREMGFRIAVDDLGAGYAGLTSFALLEPEIVKLDMTLVRDVHLSPTKQKLIRSMTALCKDMGMLVVGEGIETAEERDTLVSLGCDLLQGYLFAKPGKAFPEVSW